MRKPSYRKLGALLLVVGVARNAAADGFTNELSVGRILPTAKVTGTTYASDRARGSVDLSEAFSARLGASYTRYGASNGTSAEDVFQFFAGGTWEPNDHFAFDLDGNLSPTSSTVMTGVPLSATTTGNLRTHTSSFGFSAGGEYDTAGETNIESAVDASVGATSYKTTEAPRRAGRAVGPVEQAALVQWRLSVGVTETLFQDTDLGVAATYYLYSVDPTETGYYGASVFGRGAVADGIPLEPLRFALRPDALHRFGEFDVGAHYQYGRYVSDQGHSHLAGLKLQYRPQKAVKIWMGGDWQRDLDAASPDPITILWINVGVRVRF